jgi:hypothetical protein
MKRNVEARLAKLEANAGVGGGGIGFISATREEGETKEGFDKRVERLVHESEQRNGCAYDVLFLFLLNHAPRLIEDLRPQGEH